VNDQGEYESTSEKKHEDIEEEDNPEKEICAFETSLLLL
jgi:hypothetical protein